MKRYLILEDGSSFPGEGIGANIISTGELAIQTTNFGYQEALTDPTNAGKILVFTSPMIGNNGINAIDYESIDPTVKGIIANDIALNISDSENFEDLSSFLKEKRIAAIFKVDTRALVHRRWKKEQLKLLLWIPMMNTLLIKLRHWCYLKINRLWSQLKMLMHPPT